MIGLVWRTTRGLALVAVLLSTLGALASVAFTLGFRTIVDADDAAGYARGVIVVAVLFTAAWAFGTLGASVNSILTDRLDLELGARIGALTAALPTLEVFERSEPLAKLDALRANRRALAGSSRQLLSAWQVGLRVAGVIVLLATVYLPVLVVPAFALAPAFADRRAGRIQRRTDDALADRRRLRDDLLELLLSSQAARELRTYGISDDLAARHAALAEAIRRDELRAALRGAAWEAAGWTVFAAGFVGAVIVLVLRAAHGHVSPGGVVMAVSLMRRAQRQVNRGTDTATSLQTSLRTARQLHWLEQQASETPAPAAERIALEGVSFAYPGSERTVLHDISLELPAGSVVAIVGENGAGKSTLVKLLLGLYPPSTGTVHAGGRSTAVFQDFQRPALTLREAVGLGDVELIADDEAIAAALERTGAPQLGLDAQLGRAFGGAELSGGQWQRLALARGLVRRAPRLVVLDEPTASVDVPTERRIFTQLATAAHSQPDAVTVLVTHRFATARAADTIVVLEHGRIVEHGSHEQLIAADGLYAELLALQARAYHPGSDVARNRRRGAEPGPRHRPPLRP